MVLDLFRPRFSASMCFFAFSLLCSVHSRSVIIPVWPQSYSIIFAFLPSISSHPLVVTPRRTLPRHNVRLACYFEPQIASFSFPPHIPV
jgi:hypothetical protein